ncbi:MAG: hypothetical protein PHS59_05740 [Paludibacter sp.]|nr:hypothetical protein [Paludibacter sp.]
MNKVIDFKNRLFENKTLRLIWFYSLAILAIIPSVFAVLHAPIDPDSSYYLSVVERMNEGLVPYSDFPIGYTPVVFYIMLFLKSIFSIGINYEFFLTIHFILQFFSALLVYKITLFFVQRKDYSFYAALLFILASHWNGGNSFLLETPSLLFGLMSLFIAIKNPHKIGVYIGVGVLSSLSFLCKQYGLGFLGLLVFLVFFDEARWKQFSNLIVGFLVPLILCYIIWGKSFFVVIGGNYGNHNTVIQGLYSISDRLLYLFVRIFPALILVFFYLPSILKKKNEIKYISMLILGILGFMLQFYFASFAHYYLYIIPFSSILLFLILSKINKYKYIFYFTVFVTVSLSLYSTYYNRLYKIYYKLPEIKENQYTLARKILNTVDSTKTLYIGDIGLIQQYYLTNMIPPNFQNVGYTFGIALDEKSHISQINDANYVLKFRKDYEFNFNTVEVKKLLDKRRKINITNEVVLYK